MIRKILTTDLLIIIIIMAMYQKNPVYADWWQRPPGDVQDVTREPRPTDIRTTEQPRPTDSVRPTDVKNSPVPTQAHNPTTVPTAKPTSGGGGGQGDPGGGGNGGSSTDDPCGPGKSYTGPYCGWSPGIGGSSGGNSTDTSGNMVAGSVGVRGLSYTSGSNMLTIADVMLLFGVLCLSLFLRSVFTRITDTR